MRGQFKYGVLKACDEVCGKKRGEVKEILGGGVKRWKQHEERKMHIRQCVGIVLRRIRDGIET